jgi:hypothetical protein
MDKARQFTPEEILHDDRCERVIMGDSDEALIAMTGLLIEDLHAIADRLTAALARIGE